MVSINFFCAVVYYGLSMNVVNLDTNLYMNVALNAVTEMPVYRLMAVLLEKLRRKPLAIGIMCFSDIWEGGNLQLIVYLYGGVVPHSGEERRARGRDAGGTNGGCSSRNTPSGPGRLSTLHLEYSLNQTD
ncbi:Organic cation/carnitine transporter [Arachis hypogaea]|nr:Organic cation/carnitine transporter [Arachis hypogaea]